MALGIILAGIGFYSLIVSLVGLSVTFLVWLNALGAGVAFVIKLLFVMVGFTLLYIGATDWSKEEL